MSDAYPRIILFQLERTGPRTFRVVVDPPRKPGDGGVSIAVEYQAIDALGALSWHPIGLNFEDVDDDDTPSVEDGGSYARMCRRWVPVALGIALHSGTIPEQGIDLGKIGRG